MTAENITVQAFGNTGSTLPLRQDDPISMVFIIKTMLVMALLLLVVYLALRWYSRRGVVTTVAPTATELQCVRELRLSPRTRVYLLNADGERLLVTESATGTTVTPLGTKHSPSEATP